MLKQENKLHAFSLPKFKLQLIFNFDYQAKKRILVISCKHLTEWPRKITEIFMNNSLKYYKYHDADRSSYELDKNDIMLTTYEIGVKVNWLRSCEKILYWLSKILFIWFSNILVMPIICYLYFNKFIHKNEKIDDTNRCIIIYYKRQ